MAKLLIKLGNVEQVYELNASATIGRDPDNTIVLAHDSVSTHHAQIVQSDGRFLLRDLNSTNGTKENGNRITEVELHDADTMFIGALECLFKATATTPETAPQPVEKQASQEQHGSPGSSLASIGKAAFAETKRYAQLAALKTKIAKAKHTGLPKCYYDLGRKCYEARCFAENYEREYKELADITESIHQKRQGVSIPEHATAVERIKVAAHNTAGIATAEALALKFKTLFVGLGETVAQQQQSVPALAETFEAVNKIKTRIAQMELQYAGLSADHAAQGQIKNAIFSLAKDAREKSREAWVEVKKKFLASSPSQPSTNTISQPQQSTPQRPPKAKQSLPERHEPDIPKSTTPLLQAAPNSKDKPNVGLKNCGILVIVIVALLLLAQQVQTYIAHERKTKEEQAEAERHQQQQHEAEEAKQRAEELARQMRMKQRLQEMADRPIDSK